MTEFFRVECSKCGELIQTTARTFSWPYVCSECDIAGKVGQKKDIAPATTEFHTLTPTSLPLHRGNTLKVVPAIMGAPGYLEPEHDPALGEATVENTTLLIEDLEAQVVASRKALEDANSLIADMNRSITNLAQQATDLGIRNFHERKRLLKMWATAAQDAEYWERMCKSARRRSTELSNDLYALASRGFFARVFNF